MPTSEQTAARLDRAAREPLWSQLLADLRSRLDAGEFATSFPGELALVQDYAVSRHTVREALRHLRQAGVVTASRGRKPMLAPAEVEQPLGALSSLFAAVEATGMEQRSVVRALEVRRDGRMAARLGCEESTPLVYLERVRLADDEPLALDRVWLPADLAEPLLAVDFRRTALYDELLARCGLRLTEGREQVRAVLPTAGERRLLHVPAGVALLAVERIGGLHGRPVELRHTLVRGDRFAVTAELHGRELAVSAGHPDAAPRSTTPGPTPPTPRRATL